MRIVCNIYTNDVMNTVRYTYSVDQSENSSSRLKWGPFKHIHHVGGKYRTMRFILLTPATTLFIYITSSLHPQLGVSIWGKPGNYTVSADVIVWYIHTELVCYTPSYPQRATLLPSLLPTFEATCIARGTWNWKQDTTLPSRSKPLQG